MFFSCYVSAVQRKIPNANVAQKTFFFLAQVRFQESTAFRFGQGHFEAVFNFYFNSRQDQKRARQIHALERVAILFLVLRHDARNAPSCFKSSPETMKPQKAGNIHVLNWGGPPLGVQILITFPTPNMGIKQIELSVSFNPFPIIVNRVSAGVPTPPDSGKTPQLKASKLAQNCGKTAVLHLQPSYGIFWSMKSKLFPQCKQRIHPVLNVYYYSLTGWYWTPGDIHNPTRKVAA